MSDPWGALGRGIESGVSAYLRGREMQIERQRLEEEKARAERDYLLAKARNDEEAAYHALQQNNLIEQRKLDLEAEERQAERARLSTEAQRQHEKELLAQRGQQELQQIRAQAAAKTKEPERGLYGARGFDTEVALTYVLGNLGLKSVGELQQLLSGPQGQTIADRLVNSLVNIHGSQWPAKDISGDFWRFLKGFNPNLKSPSDIAAVEAQRQEAATQQKIELGKREEEITQAGGQMPPLPQFGPTIPEKIKGLLPAAGAATIYASRIASPFMMMANKQTVNQPTMQEQAIIDQYTNPNTPAVVKESLVANPVYREILRKYGKL